MLGYMNVCCTIMNKMLSLPEDLVRKIANKCKNNGQSFSGVVRVCLERYVQNDKDETCECSINN